MSRETTKSALRTLRRRQRQSAGRKGTKFVRSRREYIPPAHELSGLLTKSAAANSPHGCLP